MTETMLDQALGQTKRKHTVGSVQAGLNGNTRSKRQKIANTPATKHLLSSGQHPRGLKPLGNYLFDSAHGIQECRSTGLGYASILSDELLLTLVSTLEASALCVLAQCSKALYCFTYHEELWRGLTIREYSNGGWGEFTGTWRGTYKKRKCIESGKELCIEDVPIRVEGFYSDFLFTSFRCASVPLHILCDVETDNIDRRSNLSREEFIKEYAIPNKPVILTDVVTKWPAFNKWSNEYLLEHCGDKIFRAESVDIPFRDYVTYANNCTQEEAPLYLFDKKFSEGTSLANDYSVPGYFNEDLFSVLGDQRPDYRWLIIGPQRSGSTFHVDPNSTSAWNGVITGAKKWVMYSPEIIPPGVFPSADGSEVTTPLSLAEWFINFYPETKKGAVKPIECVCRAGEMVFVPCGWWHAVMNLEPSIALTQNFVTTENLPSVLRFLKCRREQVSGSCYGEGLYERFVEAFEKQHGDQIIREIEEREGISNARVKEKENVEKQVSLWDRLLEDAGDGDDGAFTFAFGGDD